MTNKVKEKKVMTENDKLEKAEKLFLEIKELFPRCSIDIHEVDMKSIDRKIWKIHAGVIQDNLRMYLVANKIGEGHSITLYGKD